MLKYVQNRALTCIKMLLIITDAICLNLSFLLVNSWSTANGFIDTAEVISSNYYSFWAMFNLAALALSLIHHLYNDATIEHIERIYRATLKTAIALMIVFSGYALLAHPFTGIGSFLISLTIIVFLYCLISRFLLTYIYVKLPKRFNWNKKVALIGHNENLDNIAAAFSRQNAFYTVDTIPFESDEKDLSKEEKIDIFKRYFEEVSKAGIHDVFLIGSNDITDCSQELILAADHQCVQLNFVPTITANIAYGNGRQEALTMQLPVLKSHEEPMSSMENRLKKRFVDLLISSFVMVFILSWMIPLVGIIIKIQSPGPIFFRQPRSGRNNKSFDCFKFRSMVQNKDSHAKQASKDDNRITPIGRFLRKTNLDEFPQFINVFLGQMSVVGPRPHMLSHTEHYSKLIQHYMVRHFVKPGITGWAQVNGYRGETKDPQLMAKRVEYDLDYLSNWSAMLDFKIVCMTAINMIKGEENAF